MNVFRSNNTNTRWIKSGKFSSGKKSKSSKNKNKKSNLKSVVSKLENMLAPEVKYTDTYVATANITNTATFTLLNSTIQGNSAITRIGQSIRMRRLDFRYYVTTNSTAVRTHHRVLVVLDRQPNGAVFAIGTLLTNTSNGSSLCVSPYAIGAQRRFVILYDQAFALSNGGPSNCTGDVRLPANQLVEYGMGNNGDITDINTNSLYLIDVSDQSTNYPIAEFYMRVWFSDN